MNIIDDLITRGLLDKCSNEDKVREMMKTKQTLYCGFDPSAKSLQLGNFVMITMLKRLQLAGYRVIAVIGGGTGMIGDPSGKKAERSFLSEEKVKLNVLCIKEQLSKYLDFSSEEKGIIVDNYEWWSKTSVIEYLRDYGKLFQINYMLDKDIVKSRLETGISYAEFSYMILQSGDFLNLYRKYDCHIQIGGGDQWGNLTSSLDFVKRVEGGDKDVEVFTLKLITDSQGKKFGKSENGALYLDKDMTSPYTIYQYFMNVDDLSVGKFLKIFDYRSIEEIEEIIKKHMENPGLRLGQKELARVMVTSLHGVEKAKECELMSTALFSGQYKSLSFDALEELSHSLNKLELNENTLLIDALINVGLVKSRREAREMINNRSITLNGEVIEDTEHILKKEEALFNKFYFVRKGKKNYAAIKFVD